MYFLSLLGTIYKSVNDLGEKHGKYQAHFPVHPFSGILVLQVLGALVILDSNF